MSRDEIGLAELIAGAFEVGRPLGELHEQPSSAQQTWRLETTTGRFIVKRLWGADEPGWRASLADGLALERLAAERGIAMPAAVPPKQPGIGSAAEIPGHGMFRVHEWIEHRPLAATDDIATWLGETLAELHALSPQPGAPEPDWYGIYPLSTWQQAFDGAAARGRSWSAIAHRRLPDIERLTDRIAQAFRKAADPVRTHCDIEPQNILITAGGPVLIDWDTGGIDSATLQVAQAALVCSFGDLSQASKTLAAYRAAGGSLASLGPDLLIRQAGLRLCRLHYRIEADLPGMSDSSRVLHPEDDQIGARLDGLPRFIDQLAEQSIQLTELMTHVRG